MEVERPDNVGIDIVQQNNVGLNIEYPLDYIERFPGGSIITTTVDKVLEWGRESSLWYMLFGLACCSIEVLMAAGAARYDLDRFGMFYRSTPRQSDLMIVAGTVTKKMAPMVKRLYDQMSEPRYVISTGSCANSGGAFANSYSVLKGVDKIIPVDVYVPGCPPRPEALIDGVLKLREKMREQVKQKHA